MSRRTARIGLAVLLTLIVPPAARAAEGADRGRERDAVPRKITDYINVRFPGAAITRVERGRVDGRTAYAVRMQHDGAETRAIFRAGGAMLQLERALDAAPRDVARGVEARYRKARIKDCVEISVVRGKRETPHHYSATISLADGRITRVEVSPDGRHVREQRQEPFRVGGGGGGGGDDDDEGVGGDDDDDGGGGMREIEDDEGEDDDDRGGRDDD